MWSCCKTFQQKSKFVDFTARTRIFKVYLSDLLETFKILQESFWVFASLWPETFKSFQNFFNWKFCYFLRKVFPGNLLSVFQTLKSYVFSGIEVAKNKRQQTCRMPYHEVSDRLQANCQSERKNIKEQEMISIMLMPLEVVCVIFSFIYEHLRSFRFDFELGAESCEHIL